MKQLMIPILLCLAACAKEKVSVDGFREIALPIQEDLSSVWFSDVFHGSISAGTAWKSGYLLSTSDGGENWVIDTVLNRKMEQVTFSPDGQGYACGQDMLLYRPAQSPNWQLLRSDFQWLRGVHFPANTYGAVVSGEGYHSGQLRVFGPDVFWKQDTLHEVAGELEALWYADSSTLVAVGTGWVIRSADTGQSWERLHLTGDFFTDVHFPDAQNGFICGNSGSIYKTKDGGRSWQQLRKGGSTGNKNKGFRAIWFSNPLQGWVAGDGGIFWQTADGGDNWQQVKEAPENVDYTDVFVLEGKGWVCGSGGRLFRFGR